MDFSFSLIFGYFERKFLLDILWLPSQNWKSFRYKRSSSLRHVYVSLENSLYANVLVSRYFWRHLCTHSIWSTLKSRRWRTMYIRCVLEFIHMRIHSILNIYNTNLLLLFMAQQIVKERNFSKASPYHIIFCIRYIFNFNI